MAGGHLCPYAETEKGHLVSHASWYCWMEMPRFGCPWCSAMKWPPAGDLNREVNG